MAIVFEQPGAADPETSRAYGAMLANYERGDRGGGGGYGGGGGGGYVPHQPESTGGYGGGRRGGFGAVDGDDQTQRWNHEMALETARGTTQRELLHMRFTDDETRHVRQLENSLRFIDQQEGIGNIDEPMARAQRLRVNESLIPYHDRMVRVRELEAQDQQEQRLREFDSRIHVRENPVTGEQETWVEDQHGTPRLERSVQPRGITMNDYNTAIRNLTTQGADGNPVPPSPERVEEYLSAFADVQARLARRGRAANQREQLQEPERTGGAPMGNIQQAAVQAIPESQAIFDLFQGRAQIPSDYQRAVRAIAQYRSLDNMPPSIREDVVAKIRHAGIQVRRRSLQGQFNAQNPQQASPVARPRPSYEQLQGSFMPGM